MGLTGKDTGTDMPHAYIECVDGTTIAVPLPPGEHYTHVAKVHVTEASGKTVDMSRISVERAKGRAVISRDEPAKKPVPVR